MSVDMDNVVRRKVDTGNIVGFIKPFLPHSAAEFALVLIDHKVIPVPIEDDQLEYVKELNRLGKRVAIGFYYGRWHIGMPAWYSTNGGQTDKEVAYELSDNDIRYLEAVRQDFSMSVDGLLDRFGLSHMKVVKTRIND